MSPSTLQWVFNDERPSDEALVVIVELERHESLIGEQRRRHRELGDEELEEVDEIGRC